MFSEVNRTATLGLSLQGQRWNRPGDTLGLAGVLNALSPQPRAFLTAGSAEVLAAGGRLNYSLEKDLEIYYDYQVWCTVHTTLDYQFVSEPAFDRDRGPLSVLGARLHWEFYL